MVLREVLQLHIFACPPTCSVRSVKLEHSSRTIIIADSVLHSGVLFHRGFRKLLTEYEHLLQFSRSRFNKFCHSLFAECVGFKSVLGKPLFHLRYRIGVFKVGEVLHSSSERLSRTFVKGNCISDKLHIQAYTSVIYPLVEVIFLPYELGYGEL